MENKKNIGTRNEVAGNTIPQLRARHWCFTDFDEPKLTNECIRYGVYQKEMCPETKKEHFQGYIELNKPERLSWLKKNISETAHWETRKGTREQARNYCMKEESRISPPIEKGKWNDKGQGNRSDLEAVAEDLETQSIQEVALSHPVSYIKYFKGIEKLKNQMINTKQLRLNLKVIVIWGSAGIGKTRKVYQDNNVDNIYKLDHDNNNVWFDGYQGEKILLIDDFYGWIQYGWLLNLLDIYPLRLPIKNGFTYAQWETIYITSNKPPEEWYTQGLSEALKRRLHEIIHLK